MTSYFQDGGQMLPASPSSACDVIGTLYALQFVIYGDMKCKGKGMV